MKRLLVPVSLFAVGVLFSACEPTRQTQTKKRIATPTPPPTTHVDDGDDTHTPDTSSTKPPDVEPPVKPVPDQPKLQGEVPYAKGVPGKPGFVTSPYGAPGYIDVRGFPPGTEVKDPYSGKTFLVP